MAKHRIIRNAAPNDEFAAFVADLFAPLGPVVSGRFFSGHGFKLDGAQFAMIIRGTLYLKVDDALAAELAALGAKPFKYSKKGGSTIVTSYYAVPEDRLDDADTVADWARRSVAAAKQKQRKKKRKARPG